MAYTKEIGYTEVKKIEYEYILGQAKLIVRFPFPPAWIFENAQKFHYNDNYYCLNF